MTAASEAKEKMTDEIRWVKTHCARMDHGGCALLAGVAGDRIVRVKGDPNGFLNRGYVCPKGLAAPRRLTHPQRLLYPLKRTGERGGGGWRRISWSEALTETGRNLAAVKAKHGARAVAFCQGMPKGLEHFALIRLANLFGSPNVVAVQDVCHAPREISGMHTCGFYPVVDWHHPAELIVLWGSNPSATHEEGQICTLLTGQLKEGAQLIVVDPRKTALAARAKHWLQLRPGSDAALAMAMLNVIIRERRYDADFVDRWTHGFDALAEAVRGFTPEKMAPLTWVPAETIRRCARAYAEAKPAAVAWGNAIEQTVAAFDTARALICLMALCGNLDVPGGNIQANEPKQQRLGEFVRADALPDKAREMIHARKGCIPRLMTVPPAHFRRAVLEDDPYPVRAAYVQCANPLLSYADSGMTARALRKLDFVAVADVFMTPTAALADIVLPAATHFEFDDIGHYGLGHGFLLARPKVVDAPGECRPDLEIINALGKELTVPNDWFEDYRTMLDSVLAPAGIDFKAFAERGILRGPERFRKYEAKGFKTPSGKVELCLSQAEALGLTPLPAFRGLPEPEDPDFPLVLTCCKDPFFLHSSYRWLDKLRERRPRPEAWIHPETAAAQGIVDGGRVIIETRHGSILQTARLTGKILPQVVYAAYGWWFPERPETDAGRWQESNFNCLTATLKVGKEFGTPNLKGINCRILPATRLGTE